MDMLTELPPGVCYQAGDLTLDLERQRVIRDGLELPLPRLSFEVLVALVRAYPRILTVDELMDIVWSPVIVNPETVGQRIKILRQSLGDDPRNPRYIVGVRGRGYRMEAAVTRVAVALVPAACTDDAIESQTGSAGTPIPQRSSLRLWFFAIAAIAVVVIGYPLMHRWARPAVPDTVAAPVVPDRSLAVMPFLDLSEQHDQGFLADGMSEEVIDLLSQDPDLRVAARTSAFYFKDKKATVPEIAKTLGVAHVLEGSVRRSGSALRITAQLIRADTGYHVWSATYDRKIDDLFRTQDEIAGAVVGTLRSSLSRDGALSAAPPTMNVEAHTLYLQALALWNHGTASDNDRSIEYLRRAVAIDSRYAAAWAFLGQALSDATLYNMPEEVAKAPAFEAAQRALDLDPNLADAHLAMSTIQWQLNRDPRAAQASVSRALALDPHKPRALRQQAALFKSQGRLAEAEDLARESLRLDPVNEWCYATLGDMEWFDERLEEAEREYRKAIELNPAAADLHITLSVILLFAGRANEALEEMGKDSDKSEQKVLRPLMLDALGQRRLADRELRLVEKEFGDSTAHEIGVIYARRGDKDRAFAWLNRAVDNREFILQFIKVDPYLKTLRGDPRFDVLIKRLNLVDWLGQST